MFSDELDTFTCPPVNIHLDNKITPAFYKARSVPYSMKIPIEEELDRLQRVGILEPTTVQITFIFIDFRVCDFAFAFKTQNAPCVSRFKRVLFSDRFQFAF